VLPLVPIMKVPETQVNVCIIGVDGYGKYHYNDLIRQNERGTVRILGATVINQAEVPEKCARLRALGCELFTDYRAMLDRFGSQTDLCFIPTGIHLHASMTMDALRAGSNVFVEKPAAATIQEVRAMQECERETGKFVAVGYQTMYARETFGMKRAILDGKLGKIQTIKSRGLWPRLDSYYARNGWVGRLRNKNGWILDSPFNNAIAHQLNMICFLAGADLEHTAELESIQAELYRAREMESPDTACMRIVTREQLPLYFYVTHSSRRTSDPEIVIQGDKGSIRWTLGSYQTEIDGKREKVQNESFQDLRDSLVGQLLRHVKDPSTFICSLEIAAAQTLCANGAHESSPVYPIDAQWITRVPAGGSIQTIVEGLDETIDRAFEEEKLFSELGVCWAHEGRVVPLAHYEHFPQGTLRSLVPASA